MCLEILGKYLIGSIFVFDDIFPSIYEKFIDLFGIAELGMSPKQWRKYSNIG